jgi:hypothetical protein
MSRNISIIKKQKVYREYKKILMRNSVELENKYNMRIDNANRMYTVLNIPEDIIGEAYSIKKSDIDKIADNYIRQYCGELGSYLNGIGMTELYDFYDLKKVDKYSYLIIIGFSMFRTDIRRERFIKYVLPISIVTLLTIISILIFV